MCRVPPGRVTTYGTVGLLAGCPARVVGYALHHLQKTTREVPWQRVINARGGISTHGGEQRRLLEVEGIVFDDRGLVDLTRWGWPPQMTSAGSAGQPGYGDAESWSSSR